MKQLITERKLKQRTVKQWTVKQWMVIQRMVKQWRVKHWSVMQRATVLFLLAFVAVSSAFGQSYKLMTYNMRLDVTADKEDAWEYRRDLFVDQLRDIEADVFGTQEGLPHQIAYIDQKLSGYSYIGIGRDGEGTASEYSAVFYKTEKLELIRSGTFWLSKTPEKQSVGWDAALPRICTYGLFKDISSGKHIYAFNTHLDHLGEKARNKSLNLIMKKMKEFNQDNYPVILMGDMNLEPGTKAIKSVSKKYVDTQVADKTDPKIPTGTFNAFDISEPATRRIDYIFLDKVNFEIVEYSVVREPKGHSYPSDHFPVIAEVSLRN